MDGDATTRIDLVLANMTASHLCHKLEYCYSLARGLDHVPLRVTSNEQKFNDEVVVALQPAKLPEIEYQPLTAKQKNELQAERADQYEAVWSTVSADFDNAINSEVINAAHRLWCWAAETFLWRTDPNLFHLPTHFPRRGLILPRIAQPIANRINNDTGVAWGPFHQMSF